MNPRTERLRRILADPGLVVLPGCHDAISARIMERAGFPVAFMSGLAVSAARIGAPDTGLISFGEMLDQGRDICARYRSRYSATETPGTETRSTSSARSRATPGWGSRR